MEYTIEIISGHQGIFAVGRIADLDISVETPDMPTSLEAGAAVIKLLLDAEAELAFHNA
jgi:hypothetical protein